MQFHKSTFILFFFKRIPTGLCNIKHTATQRLEELWPSRINVGNKTDGISHVSFIVRKEDFHRTEIRK